MRGEGLRCSPRGRQPPEASHGVAAPAALTRSTLLLRRLAKPERFPGQRGVEEIADAAKARDSDKKAAQVSLAVAKNELKRAKELGYAGKDPEYASLDAEIAKLDGQLNGKNDTTSAFAALKQKISALFERISGRTTGAEVAKVGG